MVYKMKILLAGCGQLGLQLGRQLQRNGDEVIGIKRSNVPASFPLHLADLSESHTLAEETPNYDVIVFTATPNRYEENAYRHTYTTVLANVLDFAKRHTVPPWIIFTSSTSVYGQHQGEWVDENSPTEPTAFSGQWVLHGERYLQKHWENYLMVRFSGIYGHNRRWLINTATGGRPIQKIPPIWTNRIQDADCVGSLYFLINAYRQNQALEPVYLLSDNQPVGRYEVCAFICQLLGQPLPPIEDKNLTENCNKRCDNGRISALGYRFDYPTFTQGYRAILQ
ncbi:MAG: NAD(P)-dependent oxidoreductase [Gammaproteobacteria bacterium]|nr:MAG: NAD(P)-dependent oxidoreductase [Gammaproteobacteria bacterium]